MCRLISRRVVDLLQARRDLFPFVMAEIGVPGAGRDDQVVVVDLAAIGHHRLLLGVDAGHLGELNAAIPVAAQNAADRRGDVGGRKAGRRHLVEERLEEMIVVAVDDRDAERRAGKRLGGGDAAESRADDDDARKPGLRVRKRHLVLHSA